MSSKPNSQPNYTAAVVGLSEIGSGRPVAPSGMTWFAPMPRSHVAAYHAHPQVALVGVCDLLPSAIERFERTWRDALPDTRTYQDYREMITQEKPDILSVVTPDDKHADIVVYAAEHGVKGIFCEKPMATSLHDADRMLAACQANGAVLSVNHTYRYTPIFVQVREMLRAEAFGKLRRLYAYINHPRAMLFRNGSHFVDALCFWADAKPLWVMAELESGFDDFDSYKADGGRDASLDPSADAHIHFENDVRAYLSLAKVNNTHSGFIVVCDEAVLEVNVTDRMVTVTRASPSQSRSVEQLVVHDFQHEWELAGIHELIHLLDHGGTPLSSGASARQTVAVLMAILRSHTTGNARVAVE